MRRHPPKNDRGKQCWKRESWVAGGADSVDEKVSIKYMSLEASEATLFTEVVSPFVAL